MEAWANYFRNLASPSDRDFDDNFASGIKEQYRSLCNQSLDEFHCFTEDVVREVVLSLKGASPPPMHSFGVVARDHISETTVAISMKQVPI